LEKSFKYRQNLMGNIGSLNSPCPLCFVLNCILLDSLPQLFFAGSIAGVMNAIVVTPIERVKCLLQAQQAAKRNKNVSATDYNGSFDCARQLYKKGGIQNLFRGTCVTVLRGK